MAKFNEPEDDFSFKPLTEGLGFHKKVIDLKEDNISALSPTPWTPAVKGPSFAEPKISAPKKISAIAHVFGRGHSPATTTIAATATGTTTATKTLPQTPEAIHLVATATSWPAAIFDSTMVLGLILIFSAVIFAITKIDLSQLIEMLRTEEPADWATLVLLVSVYEIYTVSCRTFFGKTLGESVFDFRLGTKAAQLTTLYPLQVAWRSLLIAATGFITLPLISTILRQDVAGKLSGISLYAEKR